MRMMLVLFRVSQRRRWKYSETRQLPRQVEVGKGGFLWERPGSVAPRAWSHCHILLEARNSPSQPPVHASQCEAFTCGRTEPTTRGPRRWFTRQPGSTVFIEQVCRWIASSLVPSGYGMSGEGRSPPGSQQPPEAD